MWSSTVRLQQGAACSGVEASPRHRFLTRPLTWPHQKWFRDGTNHRARQHPWEGLQDGLYVYSIVAFRLSVRQAPSLPSICSDRRY